MSSFWLLFLTNRVESDRFSLTNALLFTEMQKIALDTLGFVLERIEAEAKHALSDLRLKIDSGREVLRLKRECKNVNRLYGKELIYRRVLDTSLTQPCARHVLPWHTGVAITPAAHPKTSVAQSSPAFRNFAIKTAAWSKFASPAAPAIAAPLLQMPRVLPAVVLQYLARASQSPAAVEKKKRSAAAGALTTNPHTTEPVHSGFSISPEQNEQAQEDLSPTRMTRQQRRAARAFTSLHSPVAAKSLGDSDCFRLGRGGLNGDFDEERKREPPPESSTEPALFLFPTMTRQRQLHGKYVESCFADRVVLIATADS